MRINSVIFDRVFTHTMRLAYVFFEDVVPIFFVGICQQAEKKDYYICNMCDDRDEMRWLVAPTDFDHLYQVIYDVIDVRSLFCCKPQERGYVIHYNVGDFTYEEMLCKDFPPEDIPDKGFFFQADREERKSFLKWYSGEKADIYNVCHIGHEEREQVYCFIKTQYHTMLHRAGSVVELEEG